MEIMEQSRSFDAIAGTYNSTRPGYPSAIYKLASKVGILRSVPKFLKLVPEMVLQHRSWLNTSIAM